MSSAGRLTLDCSSTKWRSGLHISSMKVACMFLGVERGGEGRGGEGRGEGGRGGERREGERREAQFMLKGVTFMVFVDS